MALSHVTIGRRCGDCTACCTLLEVKTPELMKPAGKTCNHCTAEGCGIYHFRPPICRQFKCAWLAGYLDEGDRPDLIGGIFVNSRELRRVIIHQLPGSDVTTGRLGELVKMFLAKGVAVAAAYVDAKKRKLFFRTLKLE